MQTCCICNKKIGRQETGHIFSPKYNQLILCDKCYVNKQNLQTNFEGKVDGIQKSRQYFEDLLYIGMVATAAREPLQLALKEAEEAQRESLRYRYKNRNIMSTTGYNFEGYRIVSYMDVISEEIVLNTGIFSELGGQISDISGKTNDIVAQKLNEAKEQALENLKKQAVLEGGNAVIGVSYEMLNLLENMIVVSANGTAVEIEKQN